MTSTSSSWPPRPMVSCQFMKRGCRHADLFQATYQRANRAHGVKILRCFPHCCPLHMPRSYCGGSIDLRVDGCDVPASQLRVYARLRPQEDTVARLREGDLVSKATLEAGIQSEANPSGQWIPSAVRMPSELLHATHRSLRFAISPNGRWYYTWLSGKSNGRRLTKHVLEAVVFVKHFAADSLRVVALIQSPTFTIVSFRHASGSDDSRSGLWSPYDMLEYMASPSNSPTRRPLTEETAPPANPPCDVDSGIDFGLALAAIFAMAKTQTIGSVKNRIPAWMFLADGVSSNDAVPPLVTKSSAGSLATDSPGTAASHLLWWLALDRDAHQNWSRCVSTAADSWTTNHPALRHIFHEWTQWLQSHIAQYLNELGGFSLSQLAHQSTVNCDAHPFDWRSFIAQSREGVVNRSLHRHPGAISAGDVWFCPFRNISVAHSTAELGKALDELPLSTMLAFWRLLGCIRITLDTAKAQPELAIASTRNHTLPHSPLWLVMDNRYRWFNALPDGTSTLTDGTRGSSCCSHRFGDYIAIIDDDGIVQVTMFSWPERISCERTSVPHRWSWRFCKQQLLHGRMEVDLSVSCGRLSLRETSDYERVFSSGDIGAKLSLVDEWGDGFLARLSYVKTSQ